MVFIMFNTMRSVMCNYFHTPIKAIIDLDNNEQWFALPLASTSTHPLPSVCGPLRFYFCTEMLADLWMVLTQIDHAEDPSMVCEWCATAPIPSLSLWKTWGSIVAIASPSTNHPPSASWPIRFGLCWSADADWFLSVLARGCGMECANVMWY